MQSEIADAELQRRAASPIGRGTLAHHSHADSHAASNWHNLIGTVVQLNQDVFARDPAFYRGRIMTEAEAQDYEVHARLSAPNLPYEPARLETRWTFEVLYDGTPPPGVEEEIRASVADAVHAEIVGHVEALKSTGIEPRLYLIAATPEGIRIDFQTFQPVMAIYMAYQPA